MEWTWPAALLCLPTTKPRTVMGQCALPRPSISRSEAAEPGHIWHCTASWLHIRIGKKNALFIPVSQLEPVHYGEKIKNGRGTSTLLSYPASSLHAIWGRSRWLFMVIRGKYWTHAKVRPLHPVTVQIQATASKWRFY